MYIRILLSLALAVLILGLAPATFAQQLLYIHADHLNSPRLVTNGSGTPVWRWDQTEPFGDNPPDEDPDGNSTLGHMPLRFPGQYFDKETNNHYNYFRDYDPSIGIYKQSDPIGLLGGLNTYAYGAGSPLANTDPTGQLVVAIIPALPAIGGALAEAGVAVAGLIAGAAIANALSSPSAEPAPVPNSCPAANDPGPDDCQVRQQQLLKEYEFLKRLESRGTLLRDAKIFWNKKAVIHNVVCKRYPVPTFNIGPTGVVR